MKLNIQSADISIIVQGAITLITKNCLELLRKVFPDSEIILSTWANSSADGLNADKIIFSADPGAAIVDKVAGTFNNVNRQLISTQAGLKAATRSYILKTRTDILFENADFLAYFGKYDTINSPYFENRLLICNYYTRNPRVFSACFHPSDWIVFGRSIDVNNYYKNIPLMTKEDETWFSYHPKKSKFFINYICRFTPEQYIFLYFLKNYQNVYCNSYYDRNSELIIETEKAFAQCFVVLDYQKHLLITFSKYNPNQYLEKHTLISHWQWKALYDRYCHKKFSLRWIAYRCRGIILNLFFYIKTICIYILNYLGIKELVKSFLSQYNI